MYTKVLLIAVSVSLAGAAAAVAGQPEVSGPVRGVPVRPTPPPAVVSEAGVWYPGVTKTYVFRRYVDPANPRLLHEAHVVYRREDDGGWILRPSPTVVVSGPSAGTARARKDKTPAVANELAAELARQRAETERLIVEATKYRGATEALTKEASDIAQLAKELRARLPSQGEAEARVRSALQAEIRQLSERLARLESAAAAPQPSPAPAK